MTDQTIGDPTTNFTIPQTQPAGLRIPEFILRQLIGWAIGEVRKRINTPDDVVDPLFALVPEDVRNQFRAWLMANQNLYLDVSWPRDPAWLAMIVVEPQREDEDTGNAYLGDMLGTTERGTLGGQVPTEAPAYGVPEIHTTNIWVSSNDDRLTLLLYTLVKYVVLIHKAELTKFWDIHNLVLSGGVIEHEPERLPQYAYHRVLQARYMTIFDYNGPASGPAVVHLNLNVSSFLDGVETTTPVESQAE